jgi:hypothetical protein
VMAERTARFLGTAVMKMAVEAVGEVAAWSQRWRRSGTTWSPDAVVKPGVAVARTQLRRRGRGKF